MTGSPILLRPASASAGCCEMVLPGLRLRLLTLIIKDAIRLSLIRLIEIIKMVAQHAQFSKYKIIFMDYKGSPVQI